MPAKTPDSDLELIFGADAIAAALDPAGHRKNPRKARRRVYHLASEMKAGSDALPIFRVGSLLCARPAALLEYIKQHEERVTGKA